MCLIYTELTFLTSDSFYNTESVVLCIGITATVCLCVTIFSFQSKVSKCRKNYSIYK